MQEYYLNNNKKYEVTRHKQTYKVEEFATMFDGSFYSTTGNVVFLDNYKEVREYLTEMNGGVEVYG